MLYNKTGKLQGFSILFKKLRYLSVLLILTFCQYFSIALATGLSFHNIHQEKRIIKAYYFSSKPAAISPTKIPKMMMQKKSHQNEEYNLNLNKRSQEAVVLKYCNYLINCKKKSFAFGFISTRGTYIKKYKTFETPDKFNRYIAEYGRKSLKQKNSQKC